MSERPTDVAIVSVIGIIISALNLMFDISSIFLTIKLNFYGFDAMYFVSESISLVTSILLIIGFVLTFKIKKKGYLIVLIVSIFLLLWYGYRSITNNFDYSIIVWIFFIAYLLLRRKRFINT